jgi:hypothetical protein
MGVRLRSTSKKGIAWAHTEDHISAAVVSENKFSLSHIDGVPALASSHPLFIDK